MNLETPMKSIFNNLILTRSGDVWAYYRIKSSSIPSQNQSKIEEYKDKWTSFYEDITEYEDFHLMMYPNEFDLEGRLNVLKKDIHEDAFDVASYYMQETVSVMDQRLGRLTKPDFIIGIKLNKTLLSMDADMKDNLVSMFDTATDTVVNMLGWEQEISSEFFKKYIEIEDDLASTVTTVFAERLKESELKYINRYHFVRGLYHDVDEESQNGDIHSITNTVIDPTIPGSLKLVSDQDEGYISFVVVDEYFDNMVNSDLFFEVQALPFPVEVDIKAKVEGKGMTKAALNIKHQQLKEEQNEKHSLGDESDQSTMTSAFLVKDLQNKIKKEEVSLINWLAVVVVDGRSKKECTEKARLVVRHLKGAGIKCRIPIADQLSLFYKMLPAQKLDLMDKNWIQKTTQNGLAECLLGVDSFVGSKIGFFLGWGDRFDKHTDLESAIRSSRDFVLYHPFLANQQIKGSKTRSPHCLITGDTGNGKSFLAKLLFQYISFMDVKALYIDPKKEMRKWITKIINNPQTRKDFPLYINHLEKYHFITLDHEKKENWGALDPVSFMPASKAKDLIEVIFEQIYNFKDKDTISTAFLRAISNVLERKERGEQVGSLHIIYEMQQHKNEIVREAGDNLFESVKDSIMKLLIHDGSNPSLSLTERMTILEIENMDLPEFGERIENFTKSQMKSSAVMFAVGKFCELFGMNADEKTAEFIDEAWIFTASPQGRKVERQMRRIGRSYNNAEFFISQSTKDALHDDDKGNFGVAFAFDEPSEREDVLKWMNLEPSEENQKMLGSMFQGQCLFKDIYGRTSKISIECLFEEWMGAFETINKSEVAYAEEMYL
ncbi:ATP-binding protein [Bacillus pumilus]|nr:ATP-binding protein [Bacillus pumilus]MBC3643633.1 ATP-binding protein [Bacillus pumilus]MBC3645911.1 ATP-binding protein [Bacillus pumilus]MBC3649943.1 ATP-binding protein [Bacillus pumilus]MBC3653908.1 ATP-binding protein [Bacillus pumilus]MBC3657245.1 ATP-binding protein [Bacillus pumilus]